MNVDYRNALARLRGACSDVAAAASGLSAVAGIEGDEGDAEAAMQAISLCRALLLDALKSCPELRDVFVVPAFVR